MFVILGLEGSDILIKDQRLSFNDGFRLQPIVADDFVALSVHRYLLWRP